MRFEEISQLRQAKAFQALSPSARYLLWELACLTDSRDTVFISMREMSKRFEIPYRTVQRHIDDLVNEGFLRKTGSKHRTGYFHLRNPEAQTPSVCQNDIPVGQNDTSVINSRKLVENKKELGGCHPQAPTVKGRLLKEAKEIPVATNKFSEGGDVRFTWKQNITMDQMVNEGLVKREPSVLERLETLYTLDAEQLDLKRRQKVIRDIKRLTANMS